jgi:hypothetical protein
MLDVSARSPYLLAHFPSSSPGRSCALARPPEEESMLLSFWSPKGGAGTSVFAAACGLVLARHTNIRLADFGGDQPGILGVAGEPALGLADWLNTGAQAPAEALDRFEVDVGRGLTLLPRGERCAFDASPEAGAALGVVLANDPRLTIADVGTADTDALRAVVEVSDVSVVVLRDCYLALRRAARTPLVARAAGLVVVEEEGRALTTGALSDVLNLPVLATVPIRLGISRAVDAGVFASRMPDGLERPARRLCMRLGLNGRQGRAA